MQAILDEVGTEESLSLLIQELNETVNQYETLVVFAAESNPISDETYKNLFAKSKLDIIGGIFPQLLYNDKVIKKGFLIVPQKVALKYELVHNISNPETDLDLLAKNAAKKLTSCKSLIIWVDGLSQRISVLLASLYDYFGAHINYYGGGAGRTTGRSKCIFGQKNLFYDCALLIESEFTAYTSVEHGYELFSGPHIVNKSLNNSILEINYTDAFSFYSNIVKKSVTTEINPQNLIHHFAKLPVGVQKYDGTIIIRDPISTDGQNLLCIGDVPEDSVIYVLKGNENNVIKAATVGIKKLLEKNSTTQSVFVIDCVSRLHYLGENYNKCLHAILDVAKERTVFGVFSLGEIASDGDHPLEFFSRTIVQCGLEVKL